MNTSKVTQCFTFSREIYPSVTSKTFAEHSQKHNYKEIKSTKILHKDFFAQKNHKEEKDFMLTLLKSALPFILSFPDKTLVKIWCLLKKKKMHTSALVLQSLLEHSMSLLSH